MTFETRNATFEDLSKCAQFLIDHYNNGCLNEGWTTETALRWLDYNIKRAPELFFVATFDKRIAGFTMGFVKPWSHGNKLQIEEIIVDSEFREQGVGKILLRKLIGCAQRFDLCDDIDFETYEDANGMPWKMWNKLGFEKEKELFIASSKLSDFKKKLGMRP